PAGSLACQRHPAGAAFLPTLEGASSVTYPTVHVHRGLRRAPLRRLPHLGQTVRTARRTAPPRHRHAREARRRPVPAVPPGAPGHRRTPEALPHPPVPDPPQRHDVHVRPGLRGCRHMMGRSHAISGLPAGLWVAPMVGLANPLLAIPFTITTAGYALLPDLDHPSASGTRLLGPVGTVLSKVLRRASAVVYEHTKGPLDENWNGKHRHLSHTWIFAAALGLAVSLLCLITPWVMLPVYLLGVLLAADRLGGWALAVGLLGAALAVPELADGCVELAWQIGIAVALGCAVHCLGDALTPSGCPFLWLPWPLGKLTTWAGETWYEIKLLGPLAFRTGSAAENFIVVPILVGLTCAAALPYTQHLDLDLGVLA